MTPDPINAIQRLEMELTKQQMAVFLAQILKEEYDYDPEKPPASDFPTYVGYAIDEAKGLPEMERITRGDFA